MVVRIASVLLALGCASCNSEDDSADEPSAAAGAAAGSTSADNGAAGMPTGEAMTGVAASGVGEAGGGAGAPAIDTGAPDADTSQPDADTSAPATDAGQPTADTGQSTADAASSDVDIDSGSCAGPVSSESKPGFLGDWTSGTYPSDFRNAGGNYLTISGLPNQAGMDREYAVHVPPSYDPSVPMPVVFCLHAFSMNALSFCDGMAGWLDKADQEGFIVIMPNGHGNSFNIGPGCMAFVVPAY